MNIPIVISTLKEVSGWINNSSEQLNKIIDELENSELSEFRLNQLRYELSTKMLFHPKCLGDYYVPDFVGDGTPFAWGNYLCHVAEICQNNLR